MIAVLQIRRMPHYRRDAFEVGLRKNGYAIVTAGKPTGPDDLLVIWNRYGPTETQADAWERAGGTVLVCENGYIGKDPHGRQYYAISARGHNGSGFWPIGNEDRWSLLGIPLQPWVSRPEGYALICGQRGIGSKEMASPPYWHVHADRYVKAFMPTKVRLHPGNQPPKTTLEDDLAGARLCVIWSSASGVRALTLGIPVVYDAPHWICSNGAMRMRDLANPKLNVVGHDDSREIAMRAMAHAQWSIEEIESGEPFARFRGQCQQTV